MSELERLAVEVAIQIFGDEASWPNEDKYEYFYQHISGAFELRGDAGWIYVAGFVVDEQLLVVKLDLDLVGGQPIVRRASGEVSWT